jgi:hypothetical protein
MSDKIETHWLCDAHGKGETLCCEEAMPFSPPNPSPSPAAPAPLCVQCGAPFVKHSDCCHKCVPPPATPAPEMNPMGCLTLEQVEALIAAGHQDGPYIHTYLTASASVPPPATREPAPEAMSKMDALYARYSDTELAERGRAIVKDMCNGRRDWRMSIPVQAGDADIVISEIISRFMGLTCDPQHGEPSDDTVECSECGKTFSLLSALADHQEAVHE